MVPFYGWGSTTSRLEPFRGGSLLFTTKFPDITGTHFTDFGRMKSGSHSVVLDWESSALTTWPLLHKDCSSEDCLGNAAVSQASILGPFFSLLNIKHNRVFDLQLFLTSQLES